MAAAAEALNVPEEDLEDFLQGIFEKDTDEEDKEESETTEEDVEGDKEGFLQTNVKESSLFAVLQRLSIENSNIEGERYVASSLLNQTSNKQCLSKFLDEVAKFLAQCYEQAKSRKKRLHAIEIEKNFYAERSKCMSECTLGDSWQSILSLAKLERNETTDVVLQHILQHFWSTIGSRSEIIETHAAPLSHKKPDEIELLAIKDHAGWAIKRARDIVKSSSELKIKQSPKDNTILEVDKKQALELLSKLGVDKKQEDGQYRFIPNNDICPLFIKLHDITEDQLSKDNIYSHTGQVVVACLQFIATNKELRQHWNPIVLKYGFPQEVNIFILEKICTMFVKSKQQIIREQFALKPQKGSKALREELNKKSSKQNPKTKEQCSTQPNKTKTIPEVISELRQNFESPEKVSVCLKKIANDPNGNEVLSHLTGKELTKLLLSLGKPGLDGKKKSRQIDILITGNLEVKYPEKLKGTTCKEL